MRGRTVLVGVGLVCSLAAGAGPANAERLTLTRADVPGLPPAGTGAKVARAALKVELPRARARGAAFGTRKRRLRVGAFVLGSRHRAVRALRGATRRFRPVAGLGAGARRRVRVGKAGADAVVAFRIGRAIGAARFTGPRRLKRAGALIAARAYATALAARLRRVLALTAWQRTIDRIRANGSITPAIALRAFAIVYGSVPGARRPAGRLGTPRSGTLAMQFAARVWPRISRAQRKAIDRAIGAPHDARSPRLAQASNQVLTPDPALQAIADKLAAYYAKQLGTAVPKIKVFRTSEEITSGGQPAGADALPQNANGEWGVGVPVSCRVRVPPSTLKAGQVKIEFILGHEVFHCFQFTLMAAWRKRSAWIIEGSAVWAAILAAKVPKASGSFDYRTYLETANAPLFGRAYDAVGFWGRAEELGGFGSLWGKLPKILDAPDDPASFALAGGTAQPFIDTWASSSFRFSAAGSAWNQKDPYPVSHTELPPPATTITSGTTLGSNAYALHEYVVAKDPSAPLVNVTKLAGSLRAGTTQDDFGLVESDWFCFGKCACPPGKAGVVPTYRELSGSLLSLGLTGGAAQGAGRVTFHTLDEFCDAPATNVTVSGATNFTIGDPGYCVRPSPGVFQVQLPLNQGGQKAAQVVLEVTGFTGAGDYTTPPSVATVYDFRAGPTHLWDEPFSGSITIQDPGGAFGQGASGTVSSVTSGDNSDIGTTTVSVTGPWSCI
jgi:hypothetical protein